MFAHDKLVYRVVNNFDWVVPRCFSYFLLTRNFDLVIFLSHVWWLVALKVWAGTGAPDRPSMFNRSLTRTCMKLTTTKTAV